MTDRRDRARDLSIILGNIKPRCSPGDLFAFLLCNEGERSSITRRARVGVTWRESTATAIDRKSTRALLHANCSSISMPAAVQPVASRTARCYFLSRVSHCLSVETPTRPFSYRHDQFPSFEIDLSGGDATPPPPMVVRRR